jgi:anti-sigma regulatory factor (Ser/Thr protein kinase)
MRVGLPPQFELYEVLPFLGEIIAPDGSPLGREFEFDFSSLQFIKPEGMVALANVIKYLQSKGCTIRFTGVRVDESTPRDNPLKYLDDCSFFEHFLGKKLFSGSSCRKTTIPLNFIETQSYYSWIRNKVIPWLDKRIGIDTQRQLPEFSACMDEIFNNIIDHAHVQIASVHMQHYPRDNQVFIAVADFGVGIPTNIRKVQAFGSLSDAQCLKRAIEHGISSKTTPRNRGAGLDTLLQNIIVHNKGKVRIHSLKGHLTATPSSHDMTIEIEEREHLYPGTLLLMQLRTDTIPPPQEDEEEFSWD